jgi:hypothetical protein
MLPFKPCGATVHCCEAVFALNVMLMQHSTTNLNPGSLAMASPQSSARTMRPALQGPRPADATHICSGMRFASSVICRCVFVEFHVHACMLIGIQPYLNQMLSALRMYIHILRNQQDGHKPCSDDDASSLHNKRTRTI